MTQDNPTPQSAKPELRICDVCRLPVCGGMLIHPCCIPKGCVAATRPELSEDEAVEIMARAIYAAKPDLDDNKEPHNYDDSFVDYIRDNLKDDQRIAFRAILPHLSRPTTSTIPGELAKEIDSILSAYYPLGASPSDSAAMQEVIRQLTALHRQEGQK